MICNYENIYDLCLNKYFYQYAYTIDSNNIATIYSDTNAPVYRIDSISGKATLLTNSSHDIIDSCNLDDDEILLSNWECYMIYRNSGKTILDPPIDSYKKTQIDIINKLYFSSLEYGILVTIEDYIVSQNGQNGSVSGVGSTDSYIPFSIRLPAKIENQLTFQHLASQALLAYINDDDSTYLLLDYFNLSYKLNYLNLSKILTNYFNAIQKIEKYKINLIDQIEKANTIQEIINVKFDYNLSLSKSNESIVMNI